MPSPPAIPLSNLSAAKYLYSKKGSCCFRLVVSEAIPLPHCLSGFLTPRGELAHWEAVFSSSPSACHRVMALRVESTSTQDAVCQPCKTLAESEMLTCLKASFFKDCSSPGYIGGYLKKDGKKLAPGSPEVRWWLPGEK